MRTSPYELALGVPCAYCFAEQGEPCETLTTKRPTPTHSARFQPVSAAWVEDYLDGTANGLLEAVYRLQHGDTLAELEAHAEEQRKATR